MIKSLIEEDVQAGIDGAIGMREEVKTCFQVADFQKLFKCVRVIVNHQMYDMGRQPTECKCQDDYNEHAQHFTL